MQEQRLTVLAAGALGIDLRAMSVTNDLRERLEQITLEQIEACDRRSRPTPKSGKFKPVGQITSQATRALRALWMSLDAEAAMETARAAAAVHEEVETDHNERHALLDNLAGVARELFWVQAKIDVGFHKCAGLGIYKGWILVERKDDSGPMGGFIEMLGGRIPLGPPGDTGDNE